MSWIDELRLDGYALLSQLLPFGLLDSHTEAIERVMSHFACGHNVPWSALTPEKRSQMSDALNLIEYGSGSQRPLSLAPDLQDRVREAFHEEPILTSARTRLWEEGGRSPHFDTAALSTTPKDKVLRTWAALDDISAESGAFYVYPETHHNLPDQVCQEIYDLPGVKEKFDRLASVYERVRSFTAIEEMLEWKRLHRFIWPAICDSVKRRTQHLERVVFPLRKGDVVVFNPRVVHGTMLRTRPFCPRKSLICEWRAQTARLYFLTEHFGPTRDLRHIPGAGFSAMLHAVHTPWGAYADPQS